MTRKPEWYSRYERTPKKAWRDGMRCPDLWWYADRDGIYIATIQGDAGKIRLGELREYLRRMAAKANREEK